MPIVSRPRILFAAPQSGCGKTTVVCALLQALKNRQLHLAAFKSGPDYLDPMFHSRILGLPSRNLDLFLLGGKEQGASRARYLLARHAATADYTLLEGAMGYYDGLGTGSTASAYELAKVTQTPVILIIDGRGAALSLGAVLKGLARFQKDSQIVGFIVNRVRPMVYTYFKKAWEKASGLRALGCFPELPDCHFSSRHLGLVTAAEVKDLQQIMAKLAWQAEKTLDLTEILRLAAMAPALSYPNLSVKTGQKVRLAVARDEAFCFYYADNLDLLKKMGAELLFFSPLREKKLPPCDGLYLGGGYPELYARQLSENEALRQDMREKLDQGLPCLAACGGFMYLHDAFATADGKNWPWVGAISGKTYLTNKLQHFGYVKLQASEDSAYLKRNEWLPAHEFHYSTSTSKATAFLTQKAAGKRSWYGGIQQKNIFAGYPHLHFWGAPKLVQRFLTVCRQWEDLHEN